MIGTRQRPSCRSRVRLERKDETNRRWSGVQGGGGKTRDGEGERRRGGRWRDRGGKKEMGEKRQIEVQDTVEPRRRAGCCPGRGLCKAAAGPACHGQRCLRLRRARQKRQSARRGREAGGARRVAAHQREGLGGGYDSRQMGSGTPSTPPTAAPTAETAAVTGGCVWGARCHRGHHPLPAAKHTGSHGPDQKQPATLRALPTGAQEEPSNAAALPNGAGGPDGCTPRPPLPPLAQEPPVRARFPHRPHGPTVAADERPPARSLPSVSPAIQMDGPEQVDHPAARPSRRGRAGPSVP